MLFGGGFATIACLQLLIFADGFFHVEGRIGFGGTEQEWGYVTVRPNANMFWWLYYTTAKSVTNDKPLVIWLDGGPGDTSSGYGNFQELGPLDLDLKPRNFTWVKDYNVLFIDNPVGTGFSYVDTEDDLATDNAQIALDLLECIRGFYKQIPSLLEVPVYIAGYSYGGKMGAEFALLWNKEQKAGNIMSNFKGILLFSSSISPINSILSVGNYLLTKGVLNEKNVNEIEEAAKKTKTAVDNEQWLDASLLANKVFVSIYKIVGNMDFYNIFNNVSGSKYASEYRDSDLAILMNKEVMQALELSNVKWEVHSDMVYNSLKQEIMRPVTDIVERLLNETDIKVFVISGEFDSMVSTPATEEWVENLHWIHSTEWHKASREPLVVEKNTEGYVKKYENFRMYWISRSGHSVPRDNPAATAAILEHLTSSG